MARFRDRLRLGGRPSSDPDTVVYTADDEGTEIIVLDAVEEPADVEPGVLASAEPLPGPTKRALRRQRQELLRLYQAQVSDLGGLVVEMARRGAHNAALVERRAADVVTLEHRIGELDALILQASQIRRGPVPMAALPPALEPPPAAPTPCARCHALLAPDANFCAYCGAARERP
jgi:hypothetical protein